MTTTGAPSRQSAFQISMHLLNDDSKWDIYKGKNQPRNRGKQHPRVPRTVPWWTLNEKSNGRVLYKLRMSLELQVEYDCVFFYTIASQQFSPYRYAIQSAATGQVNRKCGGSRQKSRSSPAPLGGSKEIPTEWKSVVRFS